MFYQEQVVNGVLCWRSTPDGDWTPKSPGELTARLLRYEQALWRIALNISGDLVPQVIAGSALDGRDLN